MADAFENTDKLVIKQQFETLEAMANAAANALDLDALGALGETANKYDVYTNDGGQKFKVVESSEYCCRVCCRPNHALQLHVFQPQVSATEEVMTMDRPCKCGRCFSCLNICRQEMTVMERGGKTLGYISEPFLGGGLSPTLEVMDREGGEVVATVTANAVCCIGGLCCDHTFNVTDARSGQNIGKIVKQRPETLGQLATEIAGDADIFELDFNKDVDSRKKATLFGALHLIDYYLFEDEGEANFDIVNGSCSFKCCDMYCCGCVVPCACGCGGGGGSGEDGME